VEEWHGIAMPIHSPLPAADDDAVFAHVLIEYNDGYADPYDGVELKATVGFWADSYGGCKIDFLPEERNPCRIVAMGEGLRRFTLGGEHIRIKGLALSENDPCNPSGRVPEKDGEIYDFWWYADLRSGEERKPSTETEWS